MAFKAGTTTFVALDGVSGTPVNISGYCDTQSWPHSVSTLEVSVFGTAAKGFITGLTDGDTFTMSGPYDVAMGTLLAGLKSAHSAGSASSTLLTGVGGSVAGQLKESAEVWVMNYTINSGVGGRGDWSASLQVTGAVTTTTW